MESHRIVICLALFAACALSVSGAAVDTSSTVPPPQKEVKEVVPETKSEENIRSKKWITAYNNLGYSYYPQPLAYASYAAAYTHPYPSYYYPSMYSRYYW